AAFLPIYLAEGSMGEYTGVLFVVVTITLLCSWLLALTVIPLLCTQFLKVKPLEGEDAFNSRFYRTYRGVLVGLVRFPLVSFALVVGIFLFAMQGFGLIPNLFFPPDDTPMMTAKFEAPIGTSIEKTERLVADLDELIESELLSTDDRPDGVVNWSAYVGQGAPRFTLSYGPPPSSPEYAYLLFNLTTADVIPEFARKIEQFCAERYPSVIPTVGPLALGSVISNPVEVRVSGSDRDRVFELVDSIKAQMQTIEGTKNINDDWGQQTKKLTVAIDEARARRSGITHQDVAMSLQSVLNGYEATEYREGTELIPVTIRSIAADRKDVSKLESLNVYSQSQGTSVPLMQVAELGIEWQPAKLLRRDRLTTVTVSSELADGATPLDVTVPLGEWLEKEQASWPPGYFYEFGGELEESGKSQGAINDKLPYAGLFIVILLVAQFNSVRRALIILLTIPLALVGVVIGLLLTKSFFGFMTLLGLISLAGIVINNAIVLIDRIAIEINDNGFEPPQAIIEAAQRRLRPILLTTVTTVGGLIPLWLGGGPMWESMAIAIIFGLIFATLLTLGVVPVLYALLFRVSFKGFRYKPAGT
ncbi:MAG: efflux RND transporter permease subunit, partial [Planctomycetota bacterium]|nr:efflux RND transporter permease subunit [Planctomycetota bacterium]